MSNLKNKYNLYFIFILLLLDYLTVGMPRFKESRWKMNIFIRISGLLEEFLGKLQLYFLI